MLGQRIVAFVIPKRAEGLEAGQTEAEILRCCAALLPAYMIPRHLRLVDSLPHTASRKIDYGSLRELWSIGEPSSSEDAAHE
jgi:acyl-coenzyme A synthetase/AMP-(fatty) acid ligase